MLLRASGEHDGEVYDLAPIEGGEGQAPAHGALLVRFAEAVVEGDAQALAAARDALAAGFGPSGLVDAAAVAAIFQAVVKIADATGIGLEPYKAELSADLRRELDLDRLDPARRDGA